MEKIQMNQNKDLFFKDKNQKPFAEIVQSSMESFVAQSWNWNFSPDFGSFVIVEQGDKHIIGIVSSITTGSNDPARQVFAYKKTEQELLSEQPQIFHFLQTTFKVFILGFLSNDKISYFLPEKPCKIHSFVSYVPENILRDFFQSFDFLHLIFANADQILNLDELLFALLKNLKETKFLTNEKFEEFYQEYTLFIGNDYRRLKLFLKRAQNLINFSC